MGHCYTGVCCCSGMESYLLKWIVMKGSLCIIWEWECARGCSYPFEHKFLWKGRGVVMIMSSRISERFFSLLYQYAVWVHETWTKPCFMAISTCLFCVCKVETQIQISIGHVAQVSILSTLQGEGWACSADKLCLLALQIFALKTVEKVWLTQKSIPSDRTYNLAYFNTSAGSLLCKYIIARAINRDEDKDENQVPYYFPPEIKEELAEVFKTWEGDDEEKGGI